jgi:hypothetical protein
VDARPDPSREAERHGLRGIIDGGRHGLDLARSRLHSADAHAIERKANRVERDAPGRR